MKDADLNPHLELQKAFQNADPDPKDCMLVEEKHTGKKSDKGFLLMRRGCWGGRRLSMARARTDSARK